jgi:hypothetical protein
VFKAHPRDCGRYKNLRLPGMVAHNCNTSYLGGTDWRIAVQGQPGQKKKKNGGRGGTHHSYSGSIGRTVV